MNDFELIEAINKEIDSLRDEIHEYENNIDIIRERITDLQKEIQNIMIKIMENIAPNFN